MAFYVRCGISKQCIHVGTASNPFLVENKMVLFKHEQLAGIIASRKSRKETYDARTAPSDHIYFPHDTVIIPASERETLTAAHPIRFKHGVLSLRLCVRRNHAGALIASRRPPAPEKRHASQSLYLYRLPGYFMRSNDLQKSPHGG